MSYKNFLNFFNFLSSLGFVKNNKSFKGFKNYRRNKGGFINKKMNYGFSSKTQVLGPVEKKLNINVDLIGANGSLNFSLGDVLNGREYLETASNFEMVKIVGIQVVAYPNDELNNVPTYLNLDYFNRIDATNIVASDRTKIVYNDLKHPKVFNYRVPPIYRNGQKLNDWMATSNAIANMNEGRLVVYTPSESKTVNCRLVLRCIFKVPRTSSTAKFEQRVTATDLNKYTKEKALEENNMKLNNKEIVEILKENAPKEEKRQEVKKDPKKKYIRIKKQKLPVQKKLEEDPKEEEPKKVYTYEQAKKISDKTWAEENEEEIRKRHLENKNKMSDEQFKKRIGDLFSTYSDIFKGMGQKEAESMSDVLNPGVDIQAMERKRREADRKAMERYSNEYQQQEEDSESD